MSISPQPPDEQNTWLMTFEDLKKCPTVEGPDLSPTPEEIAERMKPRPNGGISLSFEDWLMSQLPKT